MRDDLAILTPEALAKLSNPGLVKRARSEIDAGKGPTVKEEPDGTVVATFTSESVTTKLVPGKPLKDTPCSCGAKMVCRHRIAAVLVYASGAGVDTGHPTSITADELTQWLGRRIGLVDAAESVGVDIELQMQPPVARFSGHTVTFAAGAQLDHAHCNCGVKSCVHVPLAVRAFQRLSNQEREKSTAKVRLGPPPRVITPTTALSSMRSYLMRLVEKGISDARGLTQAQAEARAELREYPWLDGIIEDLDVQRQAWENRSALHDPGHVRNLFMEGFARVRAAEKNQDFVSLLGFGEPLEAPLDRVRLVSLGARLSAVGSLRSMEVLFWDNATVVSWVTSIGENADIATMTAVRQIPIATLAAGQVDSRHLVRRARRTVEIKNGRDTQVLPQTGEWGNIPPPYGFSGPGDLLHYERQCPPWFLRTRARTEAIRIVATPRGANGLSWSPGRQTLSGVIEDEDGSLLRVERSYEWFAPGAIASLAETLPNARYVSGWLRGSGGRKVLEPIAVVVGRGADSRVIVPDLAPDAPIPPLPVVMNEPTEPLDAVLGRLESALETVAQEGILGGRIPEISPILRDIGLRRIAEMYSRLEIARAASDMKAATNAWADAAIAVGLARA